MPNFISTGISIGGVHSDTIGVILVKVESSGMIPTSIGGGRSVQQKKISGRDIPWFYRTDMEDQELEFTFTINSCATPLSTWNLAGRKTVFNWIYGSRGYIDVISDDDLSKIYKCVFTSPLQLQTVDLNKGYFTVSAICLPHCYNSATPTTYTIGATPLTYSIINGQNVMNADMTYNYYPSLTIVPTGTSFKWTNASDAGRVFEITGCSAGETIVVNGADKTIVGSVTPNLISSLTGKLWPRLVYGTNSITFNTAGTCVMTTQFPILQ
jgi:phage-related protein